MCTIVDRSTPALAAASRWVVCPVNTAMKISYFSHLAETGDPRRFATARALVTHAGTAPRERPSATFVGWTKLTGQGRPLLRLAAWQTVWAAQKANPVYAAPYRHQATREHNKLTATQAQTVIAAAILRHLHAVITTGRAWDPDIAVRGTDPRRQAPIAA